MNENGESLFCLADVCKSVELTNPSSVKSRLDEEDVQLIDLHALNYSEGIGNTLANFITESGFYDVLLQSSSKKVKPFRKWVTSEVLPSIRKTGGYMISKPEDTPEELMARALLVAQDALRRREERIANLEQQAALQSEELQASAPKVNYYEKVLQSTSTYNTNQIAKELGMSSVTLNQKLREMGVQYKQGGQWLLTHKYQDEDYTRTRTYPYVQRDGTPGTAMQTVWTERGREFIHGLFDLKNTIVTGVKELSRIYDNMDELERKEDVFSEPLYTDLSKIDAMYEAFQSIYCKSKMTVNDRKKFLFVIILLYCPKKLAGKKMKSGLRDKIANVLHMREHSTLSNNVKDLVKEYDSDPNFKKDVSKAYNFITQNITPDINNHQFARLG
jgi:prophage antirepressor-like protein